MEATLSQIGEAVSLLPMLKSKIDELEQQNNKLRNEIDSLKMAAYGPVLNTEQVQELTGFEKRYCRELMKEAGAAKKGKHLFVKTDDLVKVIMTEREMSPAEVRQAARKKMRGLKI
jgi:FtsZ-binding cell division protein ZapB